MELNGEKIDGKQVTLDGNTFISCEISNSVLVYKGGVLPIMRDCQINDCQWNFSDQAANTLQFMAAMYSGMGLGGMDIIDQTISNIRNNSLQTPQAVSAANDAEKPAPVSPKAKKRKTKTAKSTSSDAA